MAKPTVKSISSKSALPVAPAGKDYAFKTAVTQDQARGICARSGSDQGWWLKNRVYFLVDKSDKPSRPACTCLDYIGDNPHCQLHAPTKGEPA